MRLFPSRISWEQFKIFANRKLLLLFTNQIALYETFCLSTIKIRHRIRILEGNLCDSLTFRSLMQCRNDP